MKRSTCKTILTLVALAGGTQWAAAQGTAFTFQGLLAGQVAPSEGTCDLRFALFDAASGGGAVGSPLTNAAVGVTNGLFTTALDFGAGVFTGPARWLEIAVRTNGAAAFAVLAPRQPLTPAPYAIFAGGVSAAGIMGTISATNIGAATITSASLDPSLGVWSRSGMNLFYSGGNVGIGTANPTKVLHVVGNVTVEGAETVELRANRVALGYSTVGGFYSTAMGSSIAVGDLSTAMGLSTASKYSSTAMGWSMATGSYSTAMGVSTASKSMSTAMGWATADGDISTAMGSSTASGNLSTAMGDSTASGNYSTAMGYLTIAGGQYSLAAGNQAKANHDGSFVWADFQNPEFASTSSNQFLIRASGGVGINTTNPASALHVQTPANVDSAVRLVSGGSWPLVLNQSPASLFSITNGGQARLVIEPGGNVGIGTQNPATALHVIGTVTATTFNPPSDRNLKENLTPISPGAVLDKVAAMPITRWNFKGDAVTPHLGPMAQDFYAPFGLGTDDKHIATVDADGVALAAIQGLNEKVEVRSQKSEVSIQELQAENAELKRRLEKLERLLSQEKGGAR